MNSIVDVYEELARKTVNAKINEAHSEVTVRICSSKNGVFTKLKTCFHICLKGKK